MDTIDWISLLIPTHPAARRWFFAWFFAVGLLIAWSLIAVTDGEGLMALIYFLAAQGSTVAAILGSEQIEQWGRS